MENASKALIIAGAILLSILIIGLGMGVYNNATSSVGSSDMTAQEVSAHNQSFKAYAGKINGSQVKALLTKIENNNKEHTDRIINVSLSTSGVKPEDNKFDVTSGGTPVYKLKKGGADVAESSSTIKLMKNEIKDNTTYRVEFDESETNGCLNGCYIYLAIN